MQIGEFNPADRKFWPKNPEPGFSPEKNRKVIEGTIKKYEKHRSKIMSKFTDNLRERTDAVASYLTGTGGAARNRSVDKYFGKTYLAHLRGQKITNQLMKNRMSVITKPEVLAEEKQSQEKLKTYALKRKGIKIKRTKTDEQKSKKRKKKV